MTESAPKAHPERPPRPAAPEKQLVPPVEDAHENIPGASSPEDSQEKLKEAQEKARTASNPSTSTPLPKAANTNTPKAANDNHENGHSHGMSAGGFFGFLGFWFFSVPKAIILGIAKRMGEQKGGGGGHTSSGGGGGGHH